MASRNDHLARVLNQYPQLEGSTQSTFDHISQSPILVVGAGGIGCELLKNLVLCGFKNIEIIDLDTIDVSNLNRQFLFRQQHVGKSKAAIAKETALKFNPHVDIVAHHGNIKSPQFGVDYFKRFSLAMNALDNVAARQHVNRMCLAAGIPLLDGGTAGYLGQVMTIKKGETECYECHPKPRQQSFAVCTIRSNPSTMVHCVVWAKMLFERLFGKASEANDIADFQKVVEIQDENEFARAVFELVFKEQIIESATIKDQTVWANNTPPVPIELDEIMSTETTTDQNSAIQDLQVLSTKQNATTFLETVKTLKSIRKSSTADIQFDKDDDLAMTFVAAAANLRAHNFHIERESKHDVKGKAGNIVPAIATTNAIIAGVLVLEAFKVLQNRVQDCRSVYCLRNPSRFRRKECLLYPVFSAKPNPSCFVCSSNEVTVTLNPDVVSLGFFIEDVLKKELGLVEPMIMFEGDLLYECGDDIDEDEKETYDENTKRILKDIGVKDYCEMSISDSAQDIDWKVILRCDTSIEKENVKVSGKSEQPKTTPGLQSTNTEEKSAEQNVSNNTDETKTKKEDGIIVLLESDDEDATMQESSKKRKREESEDEPEAKRQKTGHSEIIELD